jgi:hypothetical protein
MMDWRGPYRAGNLMLEATVWTVGANPSCSWSIFQKRVFPLDCANWLQVERAAAQALVD